MAKSAVTSLLRYVLSDSIAESDLQAQVFSGQVNLADAQLRTFQITPGLSCTGVLGQASARWSWTQLLSSPVIVEAAQVYIIIRPGSTPQATAAAAAPEVEPSASSQNFFQRMKNRIWDQLSLRVTELHVRLEVPAGPDAGAGGAAGLTLGDLVVSVDRHGATSALAQTVQLEDLRLYVESEPRAEDASGAVKPLPQEGAYVLRGLSPLCHAERHSGRRFADWRGLEVRLDLDAPTLDWTQEQYRCLLRLASYVAGSSGASSEEAQLEGKDDEFHDAEEESSPARVEAAAASQSSRASWWPSWLSLSGRPSAPARAEDSELPEGVSAADRQLLLQEEQAPPETAKFTLSVQLKAATLNTMTSCLKLQFGGRFNLVYSIDAWHAGLNLSALSVTDALTSSSSLVLVDFSRHLAATAQPPATGDVEEESLSAEPVVTLEMHSSEKQEASIIVAPVDLRLSPGVIRLVHNFTSRENSSHASRMKEAVLSHCHGLLDEFFSDALESTSEAEGSAAAAAKASAKTWSLSLKLPSVSASVGEPWLPGACLMLQLGLDGYADTGGACSAEVRASLNLEDDQSRRPFINECTLHLSYKDGKAMARISAIDAQCGLHELSALTRAARDHVFCKMSGSTTGSSSEAAVTFDVSIPSVCFRVIDEIGVEILTNLDSPWIYFDGIALTAGASPCVVQVKVDGQSRGSLRLTNTDFKWNPQAKFAYEVSSAVEVLDAAVNYVALSCKSVTVQANYDAGLCVNPALSHETLYCFQLKVSNIAPIELDSTEDFVTSLVQGLSYISDASASFCVKMVMFDSRPLGLRLEDAKVKNVSGAAAELGVIPGSTLCGVEPPTGGNILDHLRQCPLPVTLLLEEPPTTIIADVNIDTITLKASRFSAKRGVDITVEQVEVHCAGVELKSWRGNWSEFADELSQFYTRSLMRQVPWVATAISIGGRTVCQVASRTAGSTLAMLRFGTGAASAVGGTLAMGVYDAVSASARHGTRLRGGERYRFGDVTRGMLALARNRGRQVLGTYDDASPVRSCGSLEGVRETVAGSTSLVSGYVHQTRAISTTAGAAAGATLGSVVGPAGTVAGAAMGSAAGGQISKSVQDTVNKGKESAGRDTSNGYRFGDLTRGITARGREARGGETQGGYKFGDFSRGLFSKATGRGSGGSG